MNQELAKMNLGYVVKRNGQKENTSLDKITRRISKLTGDKEQNINFLSDKIDIIEITKKVVQGLHSGILTSKLDILAAEVCGEFTSTHPDYSYLGARILISNLWKNTSDTFSESMEELWSEGLIDNRVINILRSGNNAERLNNAIVGYRDFNTFNYFGFKTLERSYLMRVNDIIRERPQYMFMRVALGIHMDDIDAVIDTYEMMSLGMYIHASPTLYNSGTKYNQFSSCFLLNMEDSIKGIFKCVADCAELSKRAGGLGVHMSDIRGNGSYIAGTNGYSDGVIPWIRILNMTAKGVNQGGRRPGSVAIYQDVWHSDILQHIDVRLPTGNEDQRARDIFTAVNLNDEFMKCVEENKEWYLMCPKECPRISEVYGDEFKELYWDYVRQGKYKEKRMAKEIMERIIDSQLQTGTPYLLNKDVYNKLNNQKNLGVLKGSNLCAEILIRTTPDEIGTCNLASLLLGNYVNEAEGEFNYNKLAENAGKLVRNLNKIVDNNYYVLPESKKSNLEHRPIAIGVQGLADVFFRMKVPFTSDDAMKINKNIFEAIYYGAIRASCDLSRELNKKYSSFDGSPFSKGQFQFDLIQSELGKEIELSGMFDWNGLREDVKKYGMMNSLLTAIMPTASTSNIMGMTECIEPIKSNLYYRRGTFGEMCIINKYLVQELEKLDLWDELMKKQLEYYEGSVQEIDEIPDELKERFLTVWEMKQRFLIKMSSDRQAFVDQTQSFNIYVKESKRGLVNQIHRESWKQGLKTLCYYVHSRPGKTPTKFNLSVEDMKIIENRKKSKDNEDNNDDKKEEEKQVQYVYTEPECSACG